MVYAFSAYPTEGLTSISDKFPAFYTQKYTQKKVTLTNTEYMDTWARNVPGSTQIKTFYHRKSFQTIPQVYKNERK